MSNNLNSYAIILHKNCFTLKIHFCARFLYIFYPTASENDYADCNALVVVFISHSRQDEDQTSRKGASAIWTPFVTDNCISLSGKPKIFFIQVKFTT